MINRKNMNLILALHNHQPVGNLPEVFETVFEQSYRPFVEVLSCHPHVKVTLHYTGILLDWMEEHRPYFLEKLRRLVERGQVEMMGGGYYEPILPIIPDEDKTGQIRRLSQRVKKLFGVEPEGMWLAERIWEPHLARPIASAGLRYITVDDAHFHEVGYRNLYHYYLTEEEGWELCIFPISEKLRYLIPFRPVDEVISFLRKQLRHDEDPGLPEDSTLEKRGAGYDSGNLLVLADDGEKFGSWPETYRAVYQEKWLDRFFTALEENRDWLSTTTFSEFMKKEPPEGLVYIPAASYREMKEWSRGYWRNFLTRYPESNRMHKKMLSVRRRITRLPEGEIRDRAFQHLWAGQCNCAYWHGVFGGLYLNFLRNAIWEQLLKAEELAESGLHGREGRVEVRSFDFDFDGQEETIVVSDRFSLMFAPHRGGSLWELSWRPAAVNLLDTLTRRPEEYHRDLVEQASAPSDARSEEEEDGVKSIHHLQVARESNLRKYLQYDAYPRGGLMEHFIPEEEDQTGAGSTGSQEGEVNLEDFAAGSSPDEAGILLQPSTLEVLHRDDNTGGISLVFRRRVSREQYDFLLQKEVAVWPGSDSLEIRYLLENYSEQTLMGRLGVEFNLAFMSGNDESRYYRIPDRELNDSSMSSRGEEEGVETLEMYDHRRNLALRLGFEDHALLWRFPVETVSRSEEGMERVYQQSAVIPQWRVQLSAGEKRTAEMKLEFSFLGQGPLEGDYPEKAVSKAGGVESR